MPVTTADLITSIRNKANVQRTRNVLDTDILGFVNDAIADLWDTVVTSRGPYFAKSASFTLPSGSNAITLAEATTGVPPVPEYPVAVPAPDTRSPIIPNHTFSSLVAASTDPQFFAVGGAASFPTSQGFVPPAGRVLQLGITATLVTANTRFTIYKNGEPTGATIYVPNGTTGSTNVTEGDFGGPVYFNGEDVMDLVAIESGTPASYTFEAITIFQLDQPESDFQAELGCSYGIGANLREIPPLPTLTDRGRVSTPHFWLAGDVLTFYPATNLPTGPITLDYIPRCVVLQDGDILPVELERFRDFIETGAVVAIKAKRGMTEDVAAFTVKQQALRARIVTALAKRKAGPRPIPMPQEHHRSRLTYRRGW